MASGNFWRVWLTSCTSLYGLVVVHDEDVDDVEEDQTESFVPLDPLIMDDADEDRDRDAVRQTISGQRPPIQWYHLHTWLYTDKLISLIFLILIGNNTRNFHPHKTLKNILLVTRSLYMQKTISVPSSIQDEATILTMMDDTYCGDLINSWPVSLAAVNQISAENCAIFRTKRQFLMPLRLYV